MIKTLPVYFNYLEDLPLALLEQELETANKDLKEATKEVSSAASYGGFEKQLKISRRKKSAATETLKIIKQVLTERREND